MNYNYKTILALAFLLVLTLSVNAATRKVLFIGNSFIYTNNMPNIMQQLSTAMGDTLIYDQNTIGGYTLQQHSTDATTIAKIFSQQWDIVIVQEQSQRPSFSPSQVATEVYPYAHIIDSMVHKNYACSQTMFLMTWGYKNGDVGNCAVYPPICTYAGMQQRLRESYLEMATNNAAAVAPVGLAWKMVRDSFATIDLYSPDDMHPGLAGSYLEACVVYASVFHKNPYGSSYDAGLASSDAAKLQRIAGRVVFDSISNWQSHANYVYAAFDRSITGYTVNFVNTSQKATSYYWTFGDAGNSTSTNPTHTYPGDGIYVVNLLATNSCLSELRTDTLYIGTAGIANGLHSEKPDVVFEINHNSVSILNRDKECQLDIYTINGTRVRTYHLQQNNIVKDVLIPGLYIYRIYNEENIPKTGKIVVP